jgi:hypothetical protein
LRHLLGSGEAVADGEEAALWATVQEATWLPAGRTLVKVALTPGKIAALEALLATTDAQRHYAVGGNLLWIAWAGPLGDLSTALQALGLSGLALIGKGDHPLLGQQSGQHFAKRIKAALDPANRLPTY